MPITKEQIKYAHWKVTEAERISNWGTTGQLNWLANISRPEISYLVWKISNRITEPTISDTKETNEIIKCAKANKNFIIFPPLHIPSTPVTMLFDTSFKKLPDGSSQRGHIVFLVHKSKSCPTSQRSNKVWKVDRSTLAEEKSVSDGCNTAYFVHKLA